MTADQMITFEVEDPAEKAGIGNGNPLSLESFQDYSYSLFYGKAMLILRSIESEVGMVRVTARAEDLSETTTTLHTVQQSRASYQMTALLKALAGGESGRPTTARCHADNHFITS